MHHSIMARVEQIMQPSQRELYFCRVAVLVEGQEDVAFLATHLHLRNQFDEFRRLGCHFIITGGKNAMSRPLAIANKLCIPAFVLFDGDAGKSSDREVHKRDNSCLLRLCGHTECDPLPSETLWNKNVVMWPTDIMAIVRADFADCWDEVVQSVRDVHGLPGGETGISRKSTILITAALETLASLEKFSSTLDKLCDAILAFARDATCEQSSGTTPKQEAIAD